MRRRPLRTAAIAAVTGLALVACSAGDDSNGQDTATGGNGTGEAGHSDDVVVTAQSIADVAAMRAATARYANDLRAAQDDGFIIITQHMEGQGYHFLNPVWSVDGFDPNEPPIIMYVNDGDDWRLVGFEWVFPEEPAEPPMEGASYGEFPAACHYDDGLFMVEESEDACTDAHPESGAGFTFWHPDLVTLHVWGWMHNPDGLFSPTNPLID
jgi:hypothetical protein